MASFSFDQNGDCANEMHLELIRPVYDASELLSSLPQISSDTWDVFGEPVIRPRIGDQYQVQLPLSVREPEFICYSRNHSVVGQRNYSDHSDLKRLSIPLKWTSLNQNDIRRKTYLEPNDVTERQNCSNEENLGIDIKYLHKKIHQVSDDHCFIVPELSSENWCETEKASFLLGLYIFEKNFVELRRFVGTKEMGTLLSFYYGEFFGSDGYRKWSESRKTKGKKCVYGRKIFSGSRQQALLSRILPDVPEECKNDLLEVSKRFVDDKIPLADYVTSLKAMVGMNSLVQAVGIGTGKQDLTRMALEPSKSNPAILLRPEIPTGKACSSLTNAEIIKFLIGDYRLSKARSNDLFWEAIWPRLLARGWHSEQPKNHGYAIGSKHCLVFLVPSVKKFSRKLVKGDHYFDSVTDVLSKVAKDPGLIELDVEDGDNKSQEEYKSTSEGIDEEDDKDQPKSHRSCYLQPRIHNSSTIKFTVVDTSHFHGKIRELRSIPPEIANELASGVFTEEMNVDISDESVDETDTIRTMLFNAFTDRVTNNPAKSGGKMLAGKRELDSNYLYQDDHEIYSDMPLMNLKKKKVLSEKEQKKVVKSLYSRKLKRGSDDYKAPIAKRCRKLTTSRCAEIRDNAVTSMSAILANGTSSSCSDTQLFTKNSSYPGSCQDKLSSTSSSKGSPAESVDCDPGTALHVSECFIVSNQTQTMIDLNLPQVYPDFENGTLTAELSEEKHNKIAKMDEQCIPPKTNIEAKTEQQSTLNSRRHGTRNRPPTTKALEALANGYLTVTRKRKIKDHEGISSRHLHHSRDVVGPIDIKSFAPPLIVKAENGEFKSGNSDMLEIQGVTESK